MKIIIKNVFTLLISVFVLFNLFVILDVPFFRQTVGFLFLTIIPGFLVFQNLRLNHICLTEKFVLVVGLSVSFLILFGLIINSLILKLGYNRPLSTLPLLFILNNILLILLFINYKQFKNQSFYLPKINLKIYEKVFLIIPISLPTLSIFSMHIMNTTGNNFLIISLFFLILLFIISVCFLNQKFPVRLYPIAIFSISLSILLLLPLRSNHIIGSDNHYEYYYFISTLNNLHWNISGDTLYDATLSISLLPAIYQSISNISPEFLFKVAYSLFFSITPLIVYILSRKYIDNSYAFIASVFFMFQHNFLMTEANARTNTAILFFALIMVVLFNDEISILKKRFLFIVFMFSMILSHYSTTYIFFIVIFCTYIGIKLLALKNKVINCVTIILFFVSIFFWYSQITETAFNFGINFVMHAIDSLNNLFIVDSRSGGVPALVGKDISSKGIPHQVEFISTWLIFMTIGIGILISIKYFFEIFILESSYKLPNFLRKIFDVEYFFIALLFVALLLSAILVPFVSAGYGITRLFGFTSVILSTFFVIGGITLSRTIKTSPYIVLLILLIPYFLSMTGVTYNIFGFHRSILLNSNGEEFDLMYVHDKESFAASWIGRSIGNNLKIYSDNYGIDRLKSQAGINSLDLLSSITENNIVNVGYIYLRYTAVINHKLLTENQQWVYINKYDSQLFSGKNKIYDNGGSEIIEIGY